MLVALMLRTGIPVSTWLTEPAGVVDLALELVLEGEDHDG